MADIKTQKHDAIVLSSQSEKDLQLKFVEMLKQAPLPEDELLANLGLFLSSKSLSRILFFHVLPNTLAPLIVQISLALSWALLTEAGLSFLGLGTQPPQASWGVMLSESRGIAEMAPWLMFFPGLAIMLGVLGFNLLGDGLRDVLDPRLRGKL